MNRKIFFDIVRRSLFGGALSQTQVAGCNNILDEAAKRKFDMRWTAYCLATAYHEVDKTMAPIAEYGRGRGRAYGEAINGRIYYGRGLVQLTWLKNYEAMGKILSVDLVANPELALDPHIATSVMFEGMKRGTFTGKKLSDYFNDAITDWTNARRIINGTDRASLVAGYAQKFHSALIAAESGVPDAAPPTRKPDTSWLAALINAILAFFKRK